MAIEVQERAKAQRRLFTVDEFDRMAESGILTEDDRVELIAGEIVEMTPIGSRHAACVSRLAHWLWEALRGRAIVHPQNPLRLGDRSETQPDILLLRPRDDYYASAHPTADDVFLLIEVADRSLRHDRSVKVPLYARHGIREVWLVDLVSDAVEVHRKPAPDGYSDSQRFARGATLAPEALPDLSLTVDAILG